MAVALAVDVECDSRDVRLRTGEYFAGLALMPQVLEIFEHHDARATWFVAHDTTPVNQIARRFPSLVDRMAACGEIGCHFHFWINGRMCADEEFQRRGIHEATRFLRSAGHAVTSFRGGNLYCDRLTLSILEEEGYLVDSSVMPGLRTVLPDGLALDYSGTWSSEPFWTGSTGLGRVHSPQLLEIPLASCVALALRARMFGLLINRRVDLVNTVLKDARLARKCLATLRRQSEGPFAVAVLSAHPYDFLSDGHRTATQKLRNLDAFLSDLEKDPNVSLVTMTEIRETWTGCTVRSEEPPSRPLIASSDIVRMKRALVASLRGARRAIRPASTLRRC